MANLATLTVKLTGDTDPFVKALQGAQNRAESFAGSIVDKLGKIGLAAGGLGALASAAKGAGEAFGLGLNVEMENVKAQLVAFTKDGGAAEKILADIKKEAATTPFAFQEMAKATAGLMPVAKQSGLALMDLVKQAEVLAASNPAQGLEGAAFALREAVGGDFTSVIERFNLPRGMINKLKEEGVPALEAVSRAMKSMGFDTDLVSNLSNTASGRWSTLMDTFDTLRASLSAPIFEILSNGIGQLQPKLDELMPAMQEFATEAGAKFASGVMVAADAIKAFATGSGFDVLYTHLEEVFGPETTHMIAQMIDPIAQFRSEILPGLLAAMQPVASFMAGAFLDALKAIPPAVEKIANFVKDTTQFFKDNAFAMDVLQAAATGLAVGGLAKLIVSLPVIIAGLYAQAAAATAAAVATGLAAAPFVAIAVVFGTVVLAGIEVVKNFELIKFAAETTAKLIGQKFEELKTTVMQLVGIFTAVGSAIVENVKQGIINAWTGLTSWFSEKVKGLTSLLPWSGGGGGSADGGTNYSLQSMNIGPQPLPFFDRAGAALLAGQQRDFGKLNFKTSSEFNDILRSESLNQQVAARLAAEDAYAAALGTTRSELSTHLDMRRRQAEAVIAGGQTRDNQVAYERQQQELLMAEQRRQALDQRFLIVRLDVNGRQLGSASTRELVQDAYRLTRNGAVTGGGNE